jgi:hypothetical protein
MCAENVKMKNLKLAFFTLLLIAAASVTVAVSVMVSEDVFATSGRYTGDTSQAASVNNDCLNPIFDSNEDIDNVVGVGNCGGTVSQQDESGSASAPITSQTANPTLELQRATTTQPPDTGMPPQTCEECFDVLNDDQQLAFEGALSSTTFPVPPFAGVGTVSTIEELCEQWKAFSPEQKAFVSPDLVGVFAEAGIPESIFRTILSCLTNSVG